MERTSSFVSASDVIPFSANGEAERDQVEPAAPSLPAGHGAELASQLAHALLGFAFDLTRERALAHACHVRLGDADDLVDPIRTDPEADRRAGGDRAGRGDERVGPVVEVEQRPLGALEQDASTGVQRLVDEERRVRHVGSQSVGVSQSGLEHDSRVERLELVHALEPDVLLGHGQLDLLAQDLRVEQVLHANPDSCRLVGVGRADPAPRRPDLQGAESTLARPVECDVPGHDQVRVAGDEDTPRRRAAASFQLVELGHEHLGVDDATRPDRAGLTLHDPGRDLPDLVGLLADDDGVAGVRPTLVAADEVGVLGEEVDDLPLALVAPLRADDHGRGHVLQSRTGASRSRPAA